MPNNSLQPERFFTTTSPTGRVISLEKRYGLVYTPDPSTPILLRNIK